MAEYTKVIKLLMVTAENNNKYYDLFDHGDGTMHVEYGRVDLTKFEKEYPISKWDSLYRSKTKKGYRDVTELRVEVSESVAQDNNSPLIKDHRVLKFFDKLNAYSKKSIEMNYRVSTAAVTQAMVDEAQRQIEELHRKAVKGASDREMNRLLLDLFHTIPRKMKHVQDHLFTEFTTDEKVKHNLEIIANEQDTLDVLSNDVKMLAAQKANDVGSPSQRDKDILETLGLEIVPVTPDEERRIIKHMKSNGRQYVEAFKVVNKKTQQKFDTHVAAAQNKYVEMMYHGSRNENWLNIMNTGLLIRPTGAVHTGSMFGDGIYGADDADKSIGYCSLVGTRWAHGNANEAILGLFDFHLGKQYHTGQSDSSLSKAKLQRMGGYDSTFGHKGGGKYGGWLRKNEFIVYDNSQVTIKYLIRIKGF